MFNINTLMQDQYNLRKTTLSLKGSCWQIIDVVICANAETC